MKKFLAVVLALGLCVAVAMPAAAAVSVSGTVGYQLRYEKRGQDHATSTSSNGDEFKTFEINPNVEKAYIRFDWEAGPASPYIEIGMRKYQYKFADWTNKADVTSDQVLLMFGVDYTNPSGAWGGWWQIDREWNDDRNTAVTNGNQDSVFDASIWWQVNDMLKLSFGQFKVTGGGKGIGKTGIWAATDDDYVMRSELALPIGKLTMDIVDPKEFGATAGWLTAQEDQVGPGFAISLDTKIGPVSLTPCYQTLTYDYDSNPLNPNTGADTSFTSWAAAIPVKAAVGPVNLSAAYAWGENVAHAYTKFIQSAGTQKVTVALDAAGNWQFYDTDYTAWQVQADINAGIGKLSVGYAYEESDQDNGAVAATRTKTEYDTLQIAYEIPVGKGFTITPMYEKRNQGEAETAGVKNLATDDRTTKIYTVNFNVRF